MRQNHTEVPAEIHDPGLEIGTGEAHDWAERITWPSCQQDANGRRDYSFFFFFKYQDNGKNNLKYYNFFF